MSISEFFKPKCKHERFSTEREIGYCPDCGELIENQWYIVRCSCCGVKHKAVVKNGKIVSLDKFCENCGSKDVVVERVDKINFIDINYAVVIKKVIATEFKEFTQTWVDIKEEGCRQQLLSQSR